MKELDTDYAKALFVAGASIAAREHGMNEKDAEAFAFDVLEKTAARRVGFYDDDDEEEGSWWRKWLVPVGVGAGAFLLGADAVRNGRPDRGAWSNALNLAWKRIQALLGMHNSPMVRSLTDAVSYPRNKTEPVVNAKPDIVPDATHQKYPNAVNYDGPDTPKEMLRAPAASEVKAKYPNRLGLDED